MQLRPSNLVVSCLAALALGAAAHADYAYAKAGVRLIGQRRVESERFSTSQIGTAASDQDQYGHSASSSALSLGNQLIADMFTNTSTAGFAESYASLASVGSDVVIRRRDGTGAGSIITVTALVTPKLLTTFSGAPASWEEPFMYGTMQWTMSAVDCNGVSQSVGGSSVESMADGTTGNPTGIAYALTFQVRASEAFSLSLSMSAAAESSSSAPYAGTATATIASAMLTLGAASTSFTGDGARVAFILPEGYTADSASLGIVDNMVIVPGPGAIALIGMVRLAGMRRRR